MKSVWITDGQEDSLSVVSKIIGIVSKTTFSENQCIFAKKWNLSLNKNGQIPFMDLTQCRY